MYTQIHTYHRERERERKRERERERERVTNTHIKKGARRQEG